MTFKFRVVTFTRYMRKKTKTLNKKQKERLKKQLSDHNRRLKQEHRHSECLTFDEYVKYVYGKVRKTSGSSKNHYSPKSFYKRQTQFVPSHNSGVGNTHKIVSPEYSGDYVKGIAVMHKSNLVPITDSEQAKDIAKMRR